MPISEYLPHDSRPDEFEPDLCLNGEDFFFPCCACKHRTRSAEECFGCTHYAS